PEIGILHAQVGNSRVAMARAKIVEDRLARSRLRGRRRMTDLAAPMVARAKETSRPVPTPRNAMAEKVTIPLLQQMKREGRKSVGVVAWDTQLARIADRAGVDFISVGDSVGVNLWGHANPLEVTLEEMLICCKAVRRGVTRALVSCDFPFGPLQEGTQNAVKAAIRLVKEGGADMIKLDGAADFPDAVRALVR